MLVLPFLFFFYIESKKKYIFSPQNATFLGLSSYSFVKRLQTIFVFLSLDCSVTPVIVWGFFFYNKVFLIQKRNSHISPWMTAHLKIPSLFDLHPFFPPTADLMKENIDQALDTGDMSKSTFTPLVHNFSL